MMHTLKCQTSRHSLYWWFIMKQHSKNWKSMSAANCTVMTYEGSIKAKTKVNSSREVIAKTNKNQTNQPTNRHHHQDRTKPKMIWLLNLRPLTLFTNLKLHKDGSWGCPEYEAGRREDRANWGICRLGLLRSLWKKQIEFLSCAVMSTREAWSDWSL